MNNHSFSELFTEWATQDNLQLPECVYATARFALLDTLGCIILGYDEEQPKAAYQAALVSDRSGTVIPIGGGPKVSLLNAAIINGARAHALDYDDYELSGSSHPSSPIFSALFALAQQRDYTIQQLCDAWVVGYEAIVWLGEVLGYSHYDIGWHSTSTLGPIGTAAAASKLLNLDAEQMANAMAIATSSSAGSKLQFGFGIKAVHAGIAAKSGLQAALLAQAGLTANQSVWEGKEGFQTLYGTAESKGFKAVLDSVEFGKGCLKYPVIRKLWPSCAYTQKPIAAAIALSEMIDDVSEIKSIAYSVPEPFRRVASFTHPTNDAEARFSIPYCLIVPLIEGRMVPDDYREEYFVDQRRQHLTGLVEFDLYALPEGDPGDIGPTTPERLTVTLKDGTVHEKQMLYVPGGVQDPMTQAQLIEKLEGCGCDMSIVDAFNAADNRASVKHLGLLDQVYQGNSLKQAEFA